MNRQEAARLIEKYLKNTATQQERLLVENWYADLADKRSLTDDDHIEHVAEELWQGTRERAGIVIHKQSFRFWPQLVAAVLLLGICTFYYTLYYRSANRPEMVAVSHDVAPGSTKAILTLSNGKKIAVSDSKTGRLAKQLNTEINKLADGSIVYKDDSANDRIIAYNTISTPRAGKFDVTLEDGTLVMLDAGSSIKYPVSFIGKERKVEITGQVYFEVAHNKQKPFIVVTKGENIEVLGTHFNVNNYDDEPALKTTLLEGSVSVKYGQKSVLLKPGEAAIAHTAGDIKVEDADVEEAVAWKNGYFRFNSENIVSIMRKISRWYDIDVVYQGEISREEYSGTISRFKNISQVLKMLEYSKSVHFKVEGRRVTVSK